MARYLYEVGLKPEAFAALIKDPEDRAKALSPVFEAMGGRLEHYYFAVGHSTVYAIAQLPDEVSVHALTAAVLAGGAVTSSKVTALLSSSEAIEALKKAAKAGYAPPSA